MQPVIQSTPCIIHCVYMSSLYVRTYIGTCSLYTSPVVGAPSAWLARGAYILYRPAYLHARCKTSLLTAIEALVPSPSAGNYRKPLSTQSIPLPCLQRSFCRKFHLLKFHLGTHSRSRHRLIKFGDIFDATLGVRPSCIYVPSTPSRRGLCTPSTEAIPAA